MSDGYASLVFGQAAQQNSEPLASASGTVITLDGITAMRYYAK
jgi:hypothetical protein